MPYLCLYTMLQSELLKRGLKVGVLPFPKDKLLASTWLRAIKRDNFAITARFKVSLLLIPNNVRREMVSLMYVVSIHISNKKR